MDKLNLEKQAEEIGININSLLSLYYLYINQTEKDLKELEDLIKREELRAVRDVAHHIKGASLNLEIKSLVESTKAILAYCDEGQGWPLFRKKMDELQRDFRKLKRQIAEEDGIE